MANATEKKESIKFSDRLINFLQKNRIALIAGLGTLLVGIIAVVVIIAILDSSKEKALAAVEGLAEKYETIRLETDEEKSTTAATALITELESFAESHSGYAAARAYSVIAGIRADRKEWSEAEAAWLSAADILPDSYLAPVSIYNAATASEERGDGIRALELYTLCAEKYGTTFSQAPRAYIAIGRLNEERNDFEAATTAYKKVVDTWPNESWAKLAHGRLLAISSRGAK